MDPHGPPCTKIVFLLWSIFCEIQPIYQLVRPNFSFHEFFSCFRVQNKFQSIFTEFYKNRWDRLYIFFASAGFVNPEQHASVVGNIF
jgi:hypothetical protein